MQNVEDIPDIKPDAKRSDVNIVASGVVKVMPDFERYNLKVIETYDSGILFETVLGIRALVLNEGFDVFDVDVDKGVVFLESFNKIDENTSEFVTKKYIDKINSNYSEMERDLNNSQKKIRMSLATIERAIANTIAMKDDLRKNFEVIGEINQLWSSTSLKDIERSEEASKRLNDLKETVESLSKINNSLDLVKDDIKTNCDSFFDFCEKEDECMMVNMIRSTRCFIDSIEAESIEPSRYGLGFDVHPDEHYVAKNEQELKYLKLYKYYTTK